MQNIKRIAVAAVLICGAILCVAILLAGRAAAYDDKTMERSDDYTFSRCLRGVEPPEREPEPVVLEPAYSEADVIMAAQLMWAEARGIESRAQQAAVLWVAINRVYDARWPDTLSAVIRQSGQFAWTGREPVDAELEALARDVLDGMTLELAGYDNPWRTIPGDYFFFAGDGKRNYFRQEYRSSGRWDWSMGDPWEA